MLTLQEICNVTNGKRWGAACEENIRSIHFDTRQLTPGSMFIALTGGARDGHSFLEQAIEQGAVAALISNEEAAARHSSQLAFITVKNTEAALAKIARYYRNKLTIPLIAVTGSNGKTTTKDIISHILNYNKKVFKTFKNFNNHLGAPLSILQIRADDEIAVLELGMNHAGEIDFLASIVKPDISVIINVTDAHIEHLKTKENIAEAKAELLPHTSKDGFAVLNKDNPYVYGIRHRYPGKVYFYSARQKNADIYASNIQTNDNGTSFTVTALGERPYPFTIPMFGLHNVSNALPAILIARQFGYSYDEINDALQSLAISPMRFELARAFQKTTVINDAYNASPTSMKSSLQTFSEILPNRKKTLVLGDMFELGENSEKYHREVGEFIYSMREKFERVVTIGEASEAISKASGLPGRHFAHKLEAIDYLASYASQDSAFLFKASRGMKLEELIEHLAEVIEK